MNILVVIVTDAGRYSKNVSTIEEAEKAIMDVFRNRNDETIRTVKLFDFDKPLPVKIELPKAKVTILEDK